MDTYVIRTCDYDPTTQLVCYLDLTFSYITKCFSISGEMELTSAVRSVSCGNSNSLGPKCMSNNSGHTGGSLGRGGNLPNATRVASIAIYDEVEALHYATANFYSGVLFCLSFIILLVVYMVNRKARK